MHFLLWLIKTLGIGLSAALGIVIVLFFVVAYCSQEDR